MNNLTSPTTVLSGMVLAMLVACASVDVSAPTGVETSDTTLTTNVRTSLANQPGLNPADIMVEAYDGEVRLSGFAGNREEAEKAVAAARSITGVKVVRNDLKVREGQ
ncbi:BON domain-containing protein [Massilia sp. METH4]|uniref:BON domain-containing protein n=1 Tax=Massilia sp. METH4 TaxID=3123041 RepID=UPI0030D355FA